MVHQRRGGEEAHSTMLATGGQAQGDGQVGFARALIADQANVVVLIQPLAAG